MHNEYKLIISCLKKIKKGDTGLFVGYATYILKDNKWQLANNERNEPIISIQRAVKKIS